MKSFLEKFLIVLFLCLVSVGVIAGGIYNPPVGGGSGETVTASQPLTATTSGSTTNLSIGSAKNSGNFALQNILGGSAQLPHWNKALANVMSGKGNARILCLGDSTTEGYFSTNTASGPYYALSFCNQLANIFNGAGIPASTDNFVGNAAGDRASTVDNRLVLGSGWSGAATAGNQSLGGFFFIASSATGSTTYTPLKPVDTFVVWYPTVTGGGTLNYNIDGGSNTGINQNIANSFGHTTISTTLGTHVLNLNYGSGAGAFFTAIEAYNSTVPQVLMENAGWNGSKTSDWDLTTNNYSPSPACGTFAPDLVIINLQVNDMISSTALATYKANLQTIISNCQRGGNTDVVLMTSNHTNPADGTNPTSEATQLTYANTIRSLALTTSNSTAVAGVPVIDEFANLVSYTFQNASLGSVYTPGTYPGDLHLNYFGYGIMARDIAQVLAPAGGVIGGYGTGSGAEQTISYQPGLLSAVNATKGVFGKFAKASTVDNIEGSAITFSCVSNPTITLTNCHADTSCTTSPTTIGTVTVTAAGQAFDGSISSTAIAANEYLAWSITAGTCASIDVAATAQLHAN